MVAARYPGHELLLTQMTPTGRETAQQLYGGAATIAYLPYDYPGAVARFLARFRPRLGILMETEIWFNLVECCARLGVPLLLANARLSEKSARAAFDQVEPDFGFHEDAQARPETREKARHGARIVVGQIGYGRCAAIELLRGL